MSLSATTQFRPPIVAVMGHIDHGKTTLLDKIRASGVAQKEAGGITQHLSAYQTQVTLKSGGTKTITFIDTPGHAAFRSMRTRGSQITDIALLVVSAVDGVMAQTKEAVAQIKAAGVPLIVAMTKIDLDGVTPEKVKGQLVELDLTPEEYGGQVPLIPVSAKTGQGIPELLESISLHADVMELPNLPEASLEAVIYESRLDAARGPVVSAVIKNGTLKVGDVLWADSITGKIKVLTASDGKSIKEALPSMPVEILGFSSVPPLGAILSFTPTTTDSTPLPVLPKIGDSDTPKLKVILKADVGGTLEALRSSLSDDVSIIGSGVGAVTDSDIFLAASSGSQIFAFNVQVPKNVRTLADNEKVSIVESRVIYEILENIQSQVLKLMDPTIEETILGEAKITAEFKIDKVRIAGLQVYKGELSKGDNIHLKRGDKIIKDTKIDNLRQAKSDIDRVKATSECGVTFKPYVDFQLNDVIISYKS